MKTELESALAAQRALVGRACAHLTGDLDGEQVLLYDLAFCQAELMAHKR
ncbi:MAG: hypothetical protein R3E84_14955 [Pseudomonadales bacterium]